MSTFHLKAVAREITGKKVKNLRFQNLIPAVLYGQKVKNQNFSVKNNEFKKTFEQAGSGHFVDLQIDDAKPVKTLIHDVQHDAVSGQPIHVDFYQIHEDQKITATKELEFINEAPAVKEMGGILIKNYDEIEIECLPKDLETIDKIIIDLSVLKNFNDAIHIKDLNIPAGIKVLTNVDKAVVFVAEPQEEKVEVKAEVVEPEVVGKEKKAGEEEVEAEKPEKAKEKK